MINNPINTIANCIGSLFKTKVSQPNFSIETFGIDSLNKNFDKTKCAIDAPNRFLKYYIGSFEYNISKPFSPTYNKTVYLPILFKNEDELKTLIEHYNDLYFVLRFKEYYSSDSAHYSKCYHISELYRLDEIFEETKRAAKYEVIKAFNFYLIVKYKGYDIALRCIYNNSSDWMCNGDGFTKCEGDIDFLYKYDFENKNIIQGLTTNNLYKELSIFEDFYIKPSDNSNNLVRRPSLEYAFKYIDNLIKAYNELDNKINSMYSKKTFKLVENE